MKSKAYESALHSLVPTIIGAEQTVQKSNIPVEGGLELAGIPQSLDNNASFPAFVRSATAVSTVWPLPFNFTRAGAPHGVTGTISP